MPNTPHLQHDLCTAQCRPRDGCAPPPPAAAPARRRPSLASMPRRSFCSMPCARRRRRRRQRLPERRSGSGKARPSDLLCPPPDRPELATSPLQATSMFLSGSPIQPCLACRPRCCGRRLCRQARARVSGCRGCEAAASGGLPSPQQDPSHQQVGGRQAGSIDCAGLLPTSA